MTELADQSRRFEDSKLPYDVARKMKLLKLSLILPAPKDSAERDELTKMAASLEGDYGKGKYCPEGDKGKCLSLGDMEEIMANSRDPEELKTHLARLASGFAAISEKLCALCRTQQQGREGNGFQRHRRDVAREV